MNELIAAIAPRPCLLYTPKQDRDATYADVESTVVSAAKAWEAKGARSKLVHLAPDNYTMMGQTELAVLTSWLAEASASLLQ
jgi:hypothetical protein